MTGPTPLDYAAWRATRLGRITEAVERRAVLELAGSVEGLDVLDVGCGDGVHAVALALRGARSSGVDVSNGALAQARRNARAAGISIALAAADAARLPFPAGRFDLVMSVTALCFVASPDAAVREMARVLRPGDPAMEAAPPVCMNRRGITQRGLGLRGPAHQPMFIGMRSNVGLRGARRRSMRRADGDVRCPPI